MTPQLIARLEEAESAIRMAALSSVHEIPATLSRAVTLLENVRKDARRCPVQERLRVIARLKQLQVSLSVFSAAMERSAGIFRGYVRLAGASLEGYSPVGGSNGYRDPAFFNLSV